ncbi:MAG: tRNA 2-thiouridine(34) synthase MnmA [Wenzhouxiangellaceae bacterium]|nr:tRNA 2-thiouridine(34) synthase MnmA [Wenzhouxiangellaceae bacterium]
MSDLTMVAMSGGVDSSVTALLMKQRGENIAGMFMKNWEEDDPDGLCTATEDAADARAVAELLGIPFHARNFAPEYWDHVFAEFLTELEAGRTPNPDVLCNREIKFKVFVEHAEDLGARRIATGHYARRTDSDHGPALLKGVDADKDQSYFLYMLTAQQLERASFPIGELTKPQLRRIAADAGLPTAAKKDSTGICFIGERNFDAFIDRYLKSEPGEIRTTDNRVIGRHRGLIHYTLGQRKGLGVGGVRGFPEAPWYVVDKNLAHNCLFVTQDETDPHLLSTTLTATRLNWIGEPPEPGEPGLAAKVRYRQPDQPVQLVELGDQRLQLTFEQPQRAVTPGQSVVLYRGEQCLGGGIIDDCNRRCPEVLS